MLFFTRWKALSVLLTAIVVCLFAVPNFFPDKMVQRWPAWAQRHIVLGLDSQRTINITDLGGGLIRLTLTQAAITERIRQSVDQSIQIVERRVNELGTVEPSIQREGVDRILVQVPGLQDPTRLKEIL